MSTGEQETEEAQVAVPELVGSKLTEIRDMTDEELTNEGWDTDRINGKPPALVFDNGVVIYPSRDPEGNGGGMLFGRFEATSFYVTPAEPDETTST